MCTRMDDCLVSDAEDEILICFAFHGHVPIGKVTNYPLSNKFTLRVCSISTRLSFQICIPIFWKRDLNFDQRFLFLFPQEFYIFHSGEIFDIYFIFSIRIFYLNILYTRKKLGNEEKACTRWNDKNLQTDNSDTFVDKFAILKEAAPIEEKKSKNNRRCGNYWATDFINPGPLFWVEKSRATREERGKAVARNTVSGPYQGLNCTVSRIRRGITVSHEHRGLNLDVRIRWRKGTSHAVPYPRPAPQNAPIEVD